MMRGNFIVLSYPGFWGILLGYLRNQMLGSNQFKVLGSYVEKSGPQILAKQNQWPSYKIKIPYLTWLLALIKYSKNWLVQCQDNVTECDTETDGAGGTLVLFAYLYFTS